MKYVLSVVTLAALLFSISAIAADKVVVIPMGKGTSTETAAAWIEVYDADDTFIGHLIASDYAGDTVTITNQQKYLASFDSSEGEFKPDGELY